jgi:anti-sigma B factor antagonist
MTEPQFTISETARSDAYVIVLSGEIDMATAPALQAVLLARDGTHPLVVVDFTNVSFIDSTGLSALILGFEHLRKHGGDLRLAGLQPQSRTVLEVTGLTEVFSIHENVEDAVSWPAPDADDGS